jgi:tRNA(Ile)-lysidine synthase
LIYGTFSAGVTPAFYIALIMNLLQEFKRHLVIDGLLNPPVKILAATSGGVDSVVLCDLLYKSEIDFAIAHCNFQLRGEESERDEAFVRNIAVKYNAQILVKKFETERYAEEKKLSIQVAARDLRYDWFTQLMTESTGEKFRYTATAHHADDNIETVVMNFFRGTGLKGLIGMDVIFKGIVRPLLPFRKQDILEYAKENNLEYVEDSSNASSNYTRNYFRNELIPAVKKVFPGVEENILENINRLKEVELVYRQSIEEHKQNLIEQKGSEEHIPILKLKKGHPIRTIIWEIIKEKTFTAGQIDEVIKLMDASNGSYIQSDTHRIIKNRKWFIIAPIHNADTHHVVIEQDDKEVIFANGLLKFKVTSNHKPQTSNSIACLDADKIIFPLLLRKWKQGDYFYPLGMNKKKKLSKFFIDQKLSLTDKEKVWVVESDKRIVWVINHRIDDRFKIHPSTKNVLKITSTIN